MTAGLKTSQFHSIYLGGKPLNVTVEPNGNKVIDLGNGHTIFGNRPEDFQTLKDACNEALALFESPTSQA